MIAIGNLYESVLGLGFDFGSFLVSMLSRIEVQVHHKKQCTKTKTRCYIHLNQLEHYGLNSTA